MSDFHAAWKLSRERFLKEIADLSAEQLNFRLYQGSLSIGEAALHVAGTEVRLAAEIEGLALDPFLERVREAATEGVVNDRTFPFRSDEIRPELVRRALEASGKLWEPVVLDPSPIRRTKPCSTTQGQPIDGHGAMCRLTFHAAYHQGQAYQIKHAPGFPRSV